MSTPQPPAQVPLYVASAYSPLLSTNGPPPSRGCGDCCECTLVDDEDRYRPDSEFDCCELVECRTCECDGGDCCLVRTVETGDLSWGQRCNLMNCHHNRFFNCYLCYWSINPLLCLGHCMPLMWLCRILTWSIAIVLILAYFVFV